MASLGGSSNPNPTKMFTFKTSDNVTVKVPLKIAKMFNVVTIFYNGNLDDLAEPENSNFTLPNVRYSDLSLIVKACEVYLAGCSKREAVEEEFEANFFGQLSDETFVELVKAADFLFIQDLLDFVMPSFRKRFGLGDDKVADFVYTDEFDTILLKRPASAKTATMATYGGSSDPNPTKMATVKTSDGKLVKLPVEIAKMFNPLKDFDDGDLENKSWDISNVSSDVLNIVVDACSYRRDRNVALKKERQEFDVEVFGQQTDETIVEHVKAANYLEIKALLDFEMPSFRKWFGLGDDKGADFVYTAEFETILLRRAASASEGASTPTASRYVMVM